MIRAENIQKAYGDQVVLRSCDFKAKGACVTAIVGVSGSGKSTFLNILGGIERPDSGKVFIQDKEYSQLNERAQAKIRNQSLGFVFQEHRLLAELSAIENVLLPARIGHFNLDASRQEATRLFELLGINPLKNKMPAQLSGGEKQRFAVARALVNNAPCLLADEPSGALDQKNADTLHELFISVRDALQKTIVFVTHNEQLAQRSDEIWRMHDGKLTRER